MLSFGPYETLSRIAAGGMGEVFVAKRTGAGAFEKKVALKVLLPHLAHDREFVERFFDEARLVARMNHPNIVQIFDVGETDGRPWLAMALVEAVSLSKLEHELGKRRERLPLPLARLIATGLLEGLAYAHALRGPKGEPLGVVHRDITPSNLLVSTDGAVLLTDFGIAKASINLHRTQPGRLRGKMSYLAPETFTGEVVDQRSDLFSAGVTLYELVTGVSPFLKGTDTDTMEAVRRAQPPKVQSLRGDVTPGLAAALHRALSRSASDRFANARELREALCDGPVATAPELGEYLKVRCGSGLGAFAESSSGPGTSSLPAGHTPAAVTQPNRVPRGPVVAIGVLALLGAAGAAWWLAPVKEPAFVSPAPPPAPVAAVLEPEALPVPDEVPLTPPLVAPPSAPVRARPRKPVQPPSVDPLRVGYLTADAAPWAEVFLDGKALDRTPLSRFPVPSGRHTLVFKSADGRTVERPVRIEEGEVEVVRVQFP
ncbi:MAG: protein kinase [Myxococcaceae bacterium]|nr:protein kinase [Myxococcaceae bacterium]